MVKFCAVIMAGSRGELDPVARAAGTSHKCLVPVVGTSMLTRVLETVASSDHVNRVVICGEASLQDVPSVGRRIRCGVFDFLEAAESPAASARRAVDKFKDELPLLIVTADHPLLDHEMIDYFCTNACDRSDVFVGVARADLVSRSYPRSNRTRLRFSEGDYCGCNIFALKTHNARAAVTFWRQLEADRKHPWRLIRMLGIGSLLRYVCGRLALTDALATFSKKLGLEARAIEMPFAEAAIDVDRLADLELVESIINARALGRTIYDSEKRSG